MKHVNKLIGAVFILVVQYSLVAQSANRVTITEIMFRPLESNSEFIEIYNPSPTDSVDLFNWKIKYHTANVDLFDSTFTTNKLPPKSYAVILEGDYNFVDGIYSLLIPDSSLIIKIDNNSFGSSGMSNSSDRMIYLIDSNNKIIDSVMYTADNPSGISDEKILLHGTNEESNWGNSVLINGTPGFKNSISPFNYDAQIDSVVIIPSSPFAFDKINLSVSITNVGLHPIDSIFVNCFNDVNLNHQSIDDTLLASFFIQQLDTNETVIHKLGFSLRTSGEKRVRVNITSRKDANTLNDSVSFPFYVRPKPNNRRDIIINEIMYLPEGDEPEWIELFNTTNDSINLKGWKFKDKTSHTIVSPDSLFIAPEDYLVISSDSIAQFYSYNFNYFIKNIPSLNNSGDEIVLIDSLGNTIDSLNYSPTWGSKKGYSLERINVIGETNNENNWGNSIALEGATPGKYNSISPFDYDLELSEFTKEQEYGTVNSDFITRCKIKNKGLLSTSNATLQIFCDFNSDSIFTLNELIYSYIIPPLANKEEIELTQFLKNLPLGHLRLLAHIDFSDDQFTDNNDSILDINIVKLDFNPGDIIINEIMYTPESPEAEWFEIYNKSDKKININRFLISDGKDTTQIDTTVIYIQPKDYALISSDNFVVNKYTLSGKIIITPIPSLSNSGDKLFICDSLGRTIDSVQFNSSWGGTQGKSLERISEYSLSLDSSNWSESIAKQGATPLRINSVSQKLFDIAIDSAYFQPPTPKLNSRVNLKLLVQNKGRKTIDFNVTVLELNFYDSTEIKTLASKNITSVDSGSVVNIEFENLYDSLDDKKLIKIQLSSDKDQDTSNNFDYLTLIPSYLRGNIIVNEFMIYPTPGEPEWIELLNISNDTVNIFNWQIGDHFTHPSQIIMDNSDIELLPGEYLVVAKDSSIFDFHAQIPSKIIISNFPNMNNDEDAIILKDANGSSVDSVYYDQNWDIIRGYSLERINKNGPSSINNFGLSIDKEQSTPGRINSIAEVQKDLLIKNISITPPFPGYEEKIKFKINIANRGRERISDITLEVYLSDNVSPWNISKLSFIDAFDSTIIVIDKLYTIHDSITVKAIVLSDEDENLFNNSNSKTFYSGLTNNSVLINELMISPPDGNEWLEFFNNSGKRINLKNFSVVNLSPSISIKTITDKDFFIEPEEYFVVAKDTIEGIDNQFIVSFGSLNENEDGVVLKDFRGATLDSIFYSTDFSLKRGRSLERINKNELTVSANNWYPSVDIDGNTCGRINSVELLSSYSPSDLLINEIMYDPQSGDCEYIEFYNSSTELEINLAGIQLIKNDSINIELCPQNYNLSPKTFYLVASDSSIFNWVGNENNSIHVEKFSLSNSGEKLLLTDFWGNQIDYLEYSPKWHFQGIINTKGKSLERLNYKLPSNFSDTWSSCVSPEGGTPLKINSVFTKEGISAKGLTFSVNPFSPDGDGFEDFTIISYSLSSSPSLVRIRIFDDLGRLVRTLADSKPTGQKGEIVFDGLSDKGNHLRVGMYIVLLEAIGNNGKSFETFKEILVVATKF